MRIRHEAVGIAVLVAIVLAASHPERIDSLILVNGFPRVIQSDDFPDGLPRDAIETLLDELTDRNGQTLFEICSRLAVKHGLGSSRQAISQHLDVLEAAGLVETSREGRYKFHYLDTAPLNIIVSRWLTPTPRTKRPRVISASVSAAWAIATGWRG